MAADAPSGERQTPCERIKRDVQNVAQAERAESMALSLASGGTGAMEIVAARLAELTRRDDKLRATLHQIQMSSSMRDANVERCVVEGFRVLEGAQQLTSEVEEILVARGAAAAPIPSATASESPAAAPSPAPGSSH